MVRVKWKTSPRGTEGRGAILAILASSFGCIFLVVSLGWSTWDAGAHSVNRIPLPNDGTPRSVPLSVQEEKAAVPDEGSGAVVPRDTRGGSCPYSSLDQLTVEERFPLAGSRHQVDPPKGGRVTLVCCRTTKGPWNIMVHEKWAPLGAQRFLSMVTSDYFSNKVPLMRCIKNFLCQFGLAGAASKQFDSSIQDGKHFCSCWGRVSEKELFTQLVVGFGRRCSHELPSILFVHYNRNQYTVSSKIPIGCPRDPISR